MASGSTERAEALARVRAVLLTAGASEEEIAQAEHEDTLDLLVADRLLVPTTHRYTEAEVAEQTDVPAELARRFWRALGLPEVDPEDRTFTDLDVEAIVLIKRMMALGIADASSGLQLARVIGSSMARIAEAEITPALSGKPLGSGIESGDIVEAADRFASLADRTLPTMVRLLEFAWRRHAQAAIRRAMSFRTQGTGALPTLCVGFADMVGFTSLSQQLSDDELALVVSRFEEVAHRTITAAGGRLVKMIGDEAMFVTTSALDASRIAFTLVEENADDELLSDVRVGLAFGPVLVQDGDYYGPVVNLAHRIVSLADPGSILASDDMHRALLHELHPSGVGETQGDEVQVAARAVRPRLIKDMGRVQLWVLHSPGAEPSTVDRRTGRRWERVAEVLREIEDLRERGERALSAGLRVTRSEDEQQRAEFESEGEADLAPRDTDGESVVGQAHGRDPEGT
ncbi:MAG: adenylate/guanylate cyclase domain-containing protein [Acidimicrobiales bacterium]